MVLSASVPGIVLASKVFAEKMKGCRKNVGGEPSLMVSEVPAPGIVLASEVFRQKDEGMQKKSERRTKYDRIVSPDVRHHACSKDF